MPGASDTIPTLVSRVVEDAKDVARAEVALARARAATKLTGYRAAVGLFVAALLLALGACGALIVGLLLVLSVAIGPGWATAVVTGGLIVLAALVGWFALRRWKQA